MDIGTAIVAGLIVGLILGLIPLISGFMKHRVNLGVIGFVVTAISGAILGLLLAAPVAIVFTLAIWLWRPEPRQTTQAA